MKKALVAALIVLCLLCTVGLVACNDAGKLEMFLIEQDNKLITEDFILVGEIGGKKVSWTSSKPDLVALEKQTVKDIVDEKEVDVDQYLAKVTNPDQLTEVTLTVKLGTATKSFTFRVGPIDVHAVANKFKFSQDKKTVIEDFDLEQEFTYKGKTATITWSVDSQYQKYIKISSDNKKCLVTKNSLDPAVKINAKFKLGEATADTSYRMTVSTTKSHLEAVDAWYDSKTGDSMDFSGYVLEIATAYSAQYKNISFYMLDEDECCGVYVYRGSCDDATGAKIKPGVYVNVKGSTSTSYGGVYETNADGKVTVDDSKEKIDVSKKIKAIDNDVAGDVHALIYSQNRLVSLTNWKVKSVETTKVKEGKSGKLFTLTYGNKEMEIAVSKYLEGAYSAKESDTKWKAIINLIDTIKQNQIVTIKNGLLTSNNGKHQIALLSADDVVVAAEGTEAATYTDGTKVAAFITTLDTALNDAGAKTIIVENKTINLPTPTEAGVTVKYELCSESAAVTLDGNTVTVVPGEHDRIHLQATITSGNYSTVVFYYLEHSNMPAADMVDYEQKILISPKAVTASGETVLQAEGKIYTPVAISWAIKDPAPAYASISENKLVISKLPDEKSKLTLVATLSYGGETKTKEFTIDVAESLFSKVAVANLKTEKAYKLVMDNTQLGKSVFIKNGMSGFYIASVDDLAKGGDVYVEQVTGGHKIYFLDGTNKVYIGACTRDGKPTNTSYNITLGGKVGVANGSTDTKDPAEGVTVYDVWTITDECIKINLDPEGEGNWAFIGTFGKNVTFSMSAISRLEEGNYTAYLAEVKEAK